MIESKDNKLIKYINKLKHKKDRELYREYIIEGQKIVSEALESHSEYIKDIIVSESYAKKHNIDIEYIIVKDEIFEYITEHQTPEGILAIVRMKEDESAAIDFDAKYIAVLDEVQDPGNLGNIIRTIDSLNLKQLIISENTVDPYMPKVVRSTMGSTFRVNIIKRDILELIKELKNVGYKIYSTALDKDALNLYNLDITKEKIAVIYGNESKGISQDILNETDKLYIPMQGETDSLNVATSLAVISYEIYRQENFK